MKSFKAIALILLMKGKAKNEQTKHNKTSKIVRLYGA